MNRLLVAIAVLALFAGTAFGASLTDLQTAELAANTTGHYSNSGNSVMLRIWHTNGALSPQVGVSRNTANNGQIVLYESNGQVTDGTDRGMALSAGGVLHTNASTGDTIGEVVDIINSDTNGYWHAAAGPDGWRGMNSRFIQEAAATQSVGGTEANAVSVYLAQSEAGMVTCGISPKDNAVNRLKSVEHGVAGTGDVQVWIYDGDTPIYRKTIAREAYGSGSGTTPSSIGASPDTINFATLTSGRGIAGGKGNSLVVAVSGITTTLPPTSAEAKLIDESVISITYDQVIQ